MTFYCAWSYFFQTGLYALLIRLLSQYVEVYMPRLTILGLWLLLAVIPLFYAYRGKGKHEYQLKYSELKKWLRLKTAVLGVATVVTALAAFFAYSKSSAVPQQPAVINKIDISEPIENSLWFQPISLNGRPNTSAAVLTQSPGKSKTLSITRYTPIIANGGGTKPIRFVEHFSSDSVVKINQRNVALTGFVLPKSIPVPVRDSFKQRGLLLADQVYVYGRSAFGLEKFMLYASITLGVLALVLFARLIRAPFRNKRKLQACQDHQGNW